jgi:hypothetical protein
VHLDFKPVEKALRTLARSFELRRRTAQKPLAQAVQLPTQTRSGGTRLARFAARKLLILMVGATGLEPVTSCV